MKRTPTTTTPVIDPTLDEALKKIDDSSQRCSQRLDKRLRRLSEMTLAIEQGKDLSVLEDDGEEIPTGVKNIPAGVRA
jgi:hypothetical protein